jgi:5-methylcytosine-specific restriction endonuclease McrA
VDPRRGTVRWQRLSRQVCSEERFCPGVGGPCGHLTTETHHVVEPEEGGPFWARSNLQALCHSCHSRETARRRVEQGIMPQRD